MKEKQYSIIQTLKKLYKNKLYPLDATVLKNNVQKIESKAIQINNVDEFFKFIGPSKKILYGILESKITNNTSNVMDIVYLNTLYENYTNKKIFETDPMSFYYDKLYGKEIPILEIVKEAARKLYCSIILYEPSLELFHEDTYMAPQDEEFKMEIENFISKMEALELATEISE